MSEDAAPIDWQLIIEACAMLGYNFKPPLPAQRAAWSAGDQRQIWDQFRHDYTVCRQTCGPSVRCERMSDADTCPRNVIGPLAPDATQMARAVAVLQGIVHPVTGAVLGEFVRTGPDGEEGSGP